LPGKSASRLARRRGLVARPTNGIVVAELGLVRGVGRDHRRLRRLEGAGDEDHHESDVRE
jgi:hypothetical protein